DALPIYTYIDREIVRDPEVIGPFTDQPTLWEMTEKAIEVLSQNPNGFFLMVEAGSIDKQAHLIDWERAVWETLELDKAVGVAKRFAARNNDTLIIVVRSEEHTSELQSRENLVCRLLLEKKKN